MASMAAITQISPAHFQDSLPHSRQTCTEWTEPHWTSSCLPRHIMWVTVNCKIMTGSVYSRRWRNDLRSSEECYMNAIVLRGAVILSISLCSRVLFCDGIREEHKECVIDAINYIDASFQLYNTVCDLQCWKHYTSEWCLRYSQIYRRSAIFCGWNWEYRKISYKDFALGSASHANLPCWPIKSCLVWKRLIFESLHYYQ